MRSPCLIPVRCVAALGLVALGLLTGCGGETVQAPPPPAADDPALARRAVLVHVDLARGTAVVSSLGTAPDADGPDLQSVLLGHNEFSLTVSNVTRTRVGRIDRVRVDVALRNGLQTTLVTPSFPTPPVGGSGVYLFPFSTKVTGGVDG